MVQPRAGARRQVASLDRLQRGVGFDWISARIEQLTRYARRQLSTVQGLRILTPAGGEAGLLSFEVKGWDSANWSRVLADKGFVVSFCAGFRARIALEFHAASTNIESEMDRLAQTIDELQKGDLGLSHVPSSRRLCTCEVLLRICIAFLVVAVFVSADFKAVRASEPISSKYIFQLPDSIPRRSTPTPLSVPYQSQQIAGDPYAPSNCGPAVLAMTFAYYGVPVSVWEARQDVNSYMGIWEYSNGSSWLSLRWSAQIHGLEPYGLLDEDWLFTKWSLFDLVTESSAGHPSILLVRYWELPGHENAAWWGDHYIIFLGMDGDGNVVYHDPAFPGTIGAWRTMTQEQLMRAWNNTSVGLVRTAMSLRGSE